jgi:hypothetical protein
MAGQALAEQKLSSLREKSTLPVSNWLVQNYMSSIRKQASNLKYLKFRNYLKLPGAVLDRCKGG